MSAAAFLHPRWQGALTAFGLPSPPMERRADCGACVMCSPSDWTAWRPDLAYRADMRCCSFTPGLWSFQVGALLAEPGPERPALTARIDGPRSAPLGLLPGQMGDDRYRRAVEAGGFGRDASLRCPHYAVERGSCTIWSERNATCATWYCRHDRGLVGGASWSALHHLLGLLEGWLARSAWAAGGGRGDGWTWQEGEDRREVYRAAAAFVAAWSWEDAWERAPAQVAAAAAAYRAACGRLEDPAPRAVRRGTWEEVHRDDRRAWVVGERRVDAVALALADASRIAAADAPVAWEDLVAELGENTAWELLDRGVLVEAGRG
jgi:hypothetical protein